MQGHRHNGLYRRSAPLRFASLGRKAVVADFGGGRLTTDAGALLLREVERRLGLFDALDAAIPDPRLPELITHERRALPAQRITAIACGYEDLNDHLSLRDDPALRPAAEADPDAGTPLASPATLCRPENRIDRAALVRIAAVLVDQFIAARPEPPGHLTLDFDATDDPVHGHQEGRFFHGYYHYSAKLSRLEVTAATEVCSPRSFTEGRAWTCNRSARSSPGSGSSSSGSTTASPARTPAPTCRSTSRGSSPTSPRRASNRSR